MGGRGGGEDDAADEDADSSSSALLASAVCEDACIVAVAAGLLEYGLATSILPSIMHLVPFQPSCAVMEAALLFVIPQ